MIGKDTLCKTCPEWGTLILRVVVGVTFLMHGAQKLFGMFGGGGITGTTGFLMQVGVPFPEIFAYILACTEFFGGLGVLLGAFTQIFAFLLAIVMLVAILMVHWGHGFFAPNGFEFPFVLGGACLALVCTGCSKWGLDCYIHKFCCK